MESDSGDEKSPATGQAPCWAHPRMASFPRGRKPRLRGQPGLTPPLPAPAAGQEPSRHQSVVSGEAGNWVSSTLTSWWLWTSLTLDVGPHPLLNGASDAASRPVRHDPSVFPLCVAHCFRLFLLSFFFFCLFRATPLAYGSSQVGVQLEHPLPAYTTATAMQDPSHICNLRHSSWQCQIFNPLSQARDQTCVLMDASQI